MRNGNKVHVNRKYQLNNNIYYNKYIIIKYIYIQYYGIPINSRLYIKQKKRFQQITLYYRNYWQHLKPLNVSRY